MDGHEYVDLECEFETGPMGTKVAFVRVLGEGVQVDPLPEPVVYQRVDDDYKPLPWLVRKRLERVIRKAFARL
jgi:hypothetical protein